MRGEREGEEMIERGESYERERELLLLLLLLLSCLSFFRCCGFREKGRRSSHRDCTVVV